ncbi:hypothetical protein SAMN04488523_10858 [Sulfitobacter brevis]|uniref:Uncharacterized protein n=1 Tax=Sulfitobacter brevis TaxID=74348 RepID=A0A1I2BC50_9RHOB|nr:hypothetical protein SAMN04488523_10858 [Sulfitobacter brevis]
MSDPAVGIFWNVSVKLLETINLSRDDGYDKKQNGKYSPEVRAPAVRMVFEHQGSYGNASGRDCGYCTQDWLRLASNRRSAASGIPTTTPSLKR